MTLGHERDARRESARSTSPVAARGSPWWRDRTDLVLGGTVTGLFGATVATIATPTLQVLFIDVPIDLVLDTIGLLATAAAGLLAWIRFREGRHASALLQGSAFIVLGLPNALHVLLMVSDQHVAGGLALEAPGQGPLYVFAMASLLAAGLLVVGNSEMGWVQFARRPALVLVPPIALILAAFALTDALSGVLPALATVSAAGPDRAALPASTPVGLALSSLAALMLGWAAVLARRRWRRTATAVDRYLALGLIVAAFAQVHAALYPSTYVGVVGSGDILRLAFYVIILVGVDADARATIHALRLANEALAHLRDADVQRAALEERARMSRELHDGVAQELWMAKLKMSHLAALPDLDPITRELTDEVSAAIDASLSEARHVVQTLRLTGDAEAAFGDVLARCVEEFEDRFGVRAEVAPAGDLGRMDGRRQAELLRVVHEALTNVGRHAHATRVRVEASRNGNRVLLSIRDNGRGFHPSDPHGSGHVGLTGMRERVGLLGGVLTIDSRPDEGTHVLVDVPAAAPAAPLVVTG